MDVIYTNAGRIDDGTLKEYEIDFDTVDEMDFVITVGLDNHKLTGGSMWYIDDTEYGGIVDTVEVITASNTIQYSGRNFRGMLNSKVIEPPSGQDYKTVKGNIGDITNQILEEYGLSGCFIADETNTEIESYSFNRYTRLYDGLVAMAYKCSKVIQLNVVHGMVHIAYSDRIDYSEEMEYCQDDITFRIKVNYNAVNHLICLGKGEFKDRLIVHLYVDQDGDIVEKPAFFGVEEVTEVYENTSADTIEKLKEEGINKLGELKEADSFEVTASDRNLKIGDIIGGYEKTTGIRIRREITNIVAKIDDVRIETSYTVGGDEPGAAGIPSDIVEEYILPIASQIILGGIKIGPYFIMEDGVMSCPPITELKESIKKTKQICT